MINLATTRASLLTRHRNAEKRDLFVGSVLSFWKHENLWCPDPSTNRLQPLRSCRRYEMTGTIGSKSAHYSSSEKLQLTRKQQHKSSDTLYWLHFFTITMTLNRIIRTVLFLACAAASTSAQDLLETPIDLWSYQLLPQADLGPVEVQKGNGVFLDPSGRMAVVTTVGATVYAFNAYSGTEMWQYQTPVDGTNVASCHSAVTFSDLGYMTFSVVDNENSLTPTT